MKVRVGKVFLPLKFFEITELPPIEETPAKEKIGQLTSPLHNSTQFRVPFSRR